MFIIDSEALIKPFKNIMHILNLNIKSWHSAVS